MHLADFVAHLDTYLRIDLYVDHPNACNGLQVEGNRDITTVAFAVDACLYTIEAAVRADADCLVVHHGLFWSGSAPVIGSLYRRVSALVRAGVALYSCHLPLDAHEEVGNNTQLCRALGMEPLGQWARFEGREVGIIARADTSIRSLQRLLDDRLDTSSRLIGGGRDRVQRVAVLTGSGADRASEAAALGCDVLITGEGAHHSYFAAEEAGINVLLAGHYATETLGPRALKAHVEQELRLRCCFVDHPTGL